jgi:hypothetical protein
MEGLVVKAREDEAEISVLEISQGEVSFCVVGTAPLVFNRMSEKAKRAILMPRGRMNDADKASNMKHDPVREYRDSVYRHFDVRPTRLKFPAPAFKGVMRTAALDLPGAKKTEIGRLTWVVGDYVDIYGVPELKMGAVRMADPKRTPDIRTWATIREWCCLVTVRFVQPKLTARAVANLQAAGGVIAGIGDGRQEKGMLNQGTFRLAEQDDPDFLRIVAAGGRVAQDAALENYRCYDAETEELLEWYKAEVLRRGREAAEPKAERKKKGAKVALAT